MPNKYGLKKSPALRLCQTVTALLFLVFFVSFWLMIIDVDMFTEISNEKQEESTSQTSFQIAKVNEYCYEQYELEVFL